MVKLDWIIEREIAKASRPRSHLEGWLSVWPIGWEQKKPKRKGNTNMMTATIENDTRKEKAEARKAIRETVKHQKRVEEVKAQPRLESLTITIQWKKNRTWGSNPHATGEAITKDGFRLVGTATASGCGYCKRSTVIADLFNQFLRHKLYDSAVLERLAIKKPYGMSFPKDGQKWLACFDGGIGEGCYKQISEAIGGTWECVAYAGDVEVYQYKEIKK